MWREAGSFGEALRVYRRRAGLTQEQLSRQAGVSVRAVRNIEAGHVRPRLESARRLATAVGLNGPRARPRRLRPPAPLARPVPLAGRGRLPGAVVVHGG